MHNYYGQSVYVLVDGKGDVRYVGRTIDPDRRKEEHHKDPAKKDYEMRVVITGIQSDEEARIAENLIIHAYSFVKAIDNRRREIAVPKLGGFAEYLTTTLELYGTVAEDEALNLMEYTPFNKGPHILP